MKILLVDDHYLIGKSLELTLNKYESVTDFKHLIDPSLTLETVQTYQPSIVLMDIHMGDYNGLELAEQLIKNFSSKIIFLSGFNLMEYHERAQAIGAYGFFSKNLPIEQLMTQLEKVHFDNVFVFPKKNEQERLYRSLSPREKEILQLLAQGIKQTAIADELAVSDRTVRNHIYAINEKLETTSALTSVVKAIELGIVRVKLQ